MRANFYRIIILVCGILLVFSITLSFAYGPAPLKDKNVVMQIRKNMDKVRQEVSTEEVGLDEENAKDVAIVFKKVWEKAFLESGYDLSSTISKMAKEGPNSYSRELKEMILSIIMQITYMNDGEGPEFLYDIFSKQDADNLIKIAIPDNQNNYNRNSPDYKSVNRDEVDSLLRNIWDNMTNALRNGNIEEALSYFISSKREAYKEVFSSSSDNLRYIIKTTKNMELTDFDSSKVKYEIDFDAVVDGIPKTFGTYVIFKKDDDGSWKIYFF